MVKGMVSIIIPTFNEEKNIGRLLDSINSQSYRKLETIVVDDGSKDGTVKIARELGAIVFKRKHAERSTQRNYGAKESKGEYLLFLDADMELEKDVVKACVHESRDFSLVIIPERTVGKGLIPQVRRFEREMYEGDASIELARFFKREVFFEFGGYDPKLTGPEDYDLFYRVNRKYESTRETLGYILHHEEDTTLGRLLKKKFYYAGKGAYYAEKHPELILKQGTILFRRAYIRNWKKFLQEPLIGGGFIIIRILETIWALSGYIKSVGILGFLRTLGFLLNEKK